MTSDNDTQTPNLPDLPRDLAHSISHELFNVFTLLHAAQSDACETEDEVTDGLTDPQSRAESLIVMASDKVRQLIRTMDPYV